MKVPFTWRPTGWYQIGWSADFPAGAVTPLHYFGEDMAAYRDASGALHVLEAHCKHLGAHLAHGGAVVGDCVQCPFHGWQWGTDGLHNVTVPANRSRTGRSSSGSGR
ncbi:MAG: Rieske 2Fe-2S domain-containing protein [Acidimicrobiales bacterium]